MKPQIAISMGDPAGISPEIVAATLREIAAHSNATIYGHRPTLASVLKEEQRAIVDWDAPPHEASDGRIAFVHCGSGEMPIDHVGSACAEAQFAALEKATDAVLSKRAVALVTAPLAKNAISTILPKFSGHTEYLAERAGLESDEVTMIFAADNLSVGLVSTHIALADVPSFVTAKRLRRTLLHVARMVKLTRSKEMPKIAVAALNPHAGEDGLFGTEEQTVIGPFCEDAASLGVAQVLGPLPADTMFRDAFRGRFDGVVATYHDQALIPLKLAGVGQTVNVTMGLPFIRTSPDHGTAYDIARKGLADPAGFQAAFHLAVRMAGGLQPVDVSKPLL